MARPSVHPARSGGRARASATRHRAVQGAAPSAALETRPARAMPTPAVGGRGRESAPWRRPRRGAHWTESRDGPRRAMGTAPREGSQMARDRKGRGQTSALPSPLLRADTVGRLRPDGGGADTVIFSFATARRRTPFHADAKAAAFARPTACGAHRYYKRVVCRDSRCSRGEGGWRDGLGCVVPRGRRRTRRTGRGAPEVRVGGGEGRRALRHLSERK